MSKRASYPVIFAHFKKLLMSWDKPTIHWRDIYTSYQAAGINPGSWLRVRSAVQVYRDCGALVRTEDLTEEGYTIRKECI